MSTEAPAALRRSSSIAVRAISLVGIAAIVAVVGYLIAADREGKPEPTPLPPRKPGGALLVCGGGDISDDIYLRFVHIAGAQGRLVVIPSYAPNSDDEARLVDRWTKRGFRAVDVLHAATRAEADDPDFAEPLVDAAAVWLSGGDQTRLAERYAGTEVEHKLQALLQRGGIIGGSGGAVSAMTRVMISGLNEAGPATADAPQGLDLLPGTVIDQHFLRGNRLKRLLELLETYPGLVGLGVDEHTAVLIERNGADWSVLGKSYAVICIPTKDKAPRIEILKPGDETEIADLKLRSGADAITSSVDFNRWLSNPDFYERRTN